MTRSRRRLLGRGASLADPAARGSARRTRTPHLSSVVARLFASLMRCSFKFVCARAHASPSQCTNALMHNSTPTHHNAPLHSARSCVACATGILGACGSVTNASCFLCYKQSSSGFRHRFRRIGASGCRKQEHASRCVSSRLLVIAH